MKIANYQIIRYIVLGLGIVIVIGFARTVWSFREKHTLVAERQAALRTEELRHNQLVWELTRATSSAFIERAAREKLGLVKPGEKIVLVDQRQGIEDKKQQEEVVSNWQRWWRLFF